MVVVFSDKCPCCYEGLFRHFVVIFNSTFYNVITFVGLAMLERVAGMLDDV